MREIVTVDRTTEVTLTRQPLPDTAFIRLITEDMRLQDLVMEDLVLMVLLRALARGELSPDAFRENTSPS